MRFSRDWFTHAIPSWEEHLGHLRGTPAKALEIGSFEGRSAIWLCENILTHPDAHLTCVDPWVTTDGIEGDVVYDTFISNAASLPVGKLSRTRATFVEALMSGALAGILSADGRHSETLDFVYVDGDHMAPAALFDVVTTFEMLKPGGIAIWDDYGVPWHPDARVRAGLCRAIDAFIFINAKRLKVLHKEAQVIVRKR